MGKPAEIASEKELSKRVQLSQKTEQYALKHRQKMQTEGLQIAD